MSLRPLICSLRTLRSPVPSCISRALVAPQMLISLVQHNRCRQPEMAVVLGGQGIESYLSTYVTSEGRKLHFKKSQVGLRLDRLDVSGGECQGRFLPPQPCCQCHGWH